MIFPSDMKPKRKPKRIQRKRVKGWRMPKDSVYVGRPTEWGNFWKVGELIDPLLDPDGPVVESAEQACELFRNHALKLLQTNQGVHWLDSLRGKDLACWCREDAPWCHADILLELANR